MNRDPHDPYGASSSRGLGSPPGHAPYEFVDADNRVMDRLAGRLRWWGGLALAFGGISCLGVLGAGFVFGGLLLHWEGIGAEGIGVMEILALLGAFIVVTPMLLVYLVTGGLYLGSGAALRNVVRTQGNDVPHLIDALQKMGRAFRIEVWFTAIGFGLGLLAFIGFGVFVFNIGHPF